MVKVVPQPFGQREVTLAGEFLVRSFMSFSAIELSSGRKSFVKRLGIVVGPMGAVSWLEGG